MADTITAKRRSWNMSRIRGVDTRPERQLRSLLHSAGYRFRLHKTNLPGRPDIVLPRYRAAIFVHGCYWHRHPGCRLATTPSTRTEFWTDKFAATVSRDARKAKELTALGWCVITVWECDLEKDPKGTLARVIQQLRGEL